MSEADMQAAVVARFRAHYSQYSRCLRVSHGGKYWGGNARARAIRQQQAIAQGGVIGESDLAILLPRGGYGCLLIELKADTNKSGPTDDQLAYIEHHNAIGNKALVTKGFDMAIAAIVEYMDGY